MPIKDLLFGEGRETTTTLFAGMFGMSAMSVKVVLGSVSPKRKQERVIVLNTSTVRDMNGVDAIVDGDSALEMPTFSNKTRKTKTPKVKS